jgi:hypothetical protein
MSIPLCGLRFSPLKTRRRPNDDERGPRRAREQQCRRLPRHREEAGHFGQVEALAFVAGQVLRRQIDMPPRDGQPLLGVALGLQRECYLARGTIASASR